MTCKCLFDLLLNCPKRLSKSSDDENKKKALELKELIEERKTEYRQMEDTLPHENG